MYLLVKMTLARRDCIPTLAHGNEEKGVMAKIFPA